MVIEFTKQRKRLRDQRGQGITEYGMIIAFVSILIALAFSWAPGKLAPAVSSAFQCCVDNLNQLAAAGATGSS
jgi:Flp pilus assembly pilin Flp